MPNSPTRILIFHLFESQLKEHLTVPCEIAVMKSQADTEIKELIDNTDALVSAAYKPEWARIQTRRPLLVHSTGAGIDGISLPSLPAHSTVCNVYGHERGVAEHAFMLMLSLQRGLFSLDRSLRTGNWTPQTPYLSEMRGRSLLILGSGHIARELVRWGKFLDMHVDVLTRKPTPERMASLGISSLGALKDLHSHLPRADFVVVAIPSTPDTMDLIGTNELQRMKRTAFIINVGRAPVINEDALYAALRDRAIGGAGLDVWYAYPALGQNRLPSSRPFHELDNVIMTPHKPTFETMAFRWKEIARNIARHATGEKLVNAVWTAP